MQKIYKSAEELIGNTPLLEARNIEKKFKRKQKVNYASIHIVTKNYILHNRAYLHKNKKIPILYRQSELCVV